MKEKLHLLHSVWQLFTQSEDASEDQPSRRASKSPPRPPPRVITGRMSSDPQSVYWGMRHLPLKVATEHFLILGKIGSGKTLNARLFLQSIAHRFRPRSRTPEQLIVFDGKTNAIPMLAGLKLRPDQENVWILNPYDARSAVWDLGEATQMPVQAQATAALFVPPEPNSTAPFFANAAREVVRAVILALNATAGRAWDLRDLLCALQSRDHIAAVTARDPQAKVIASNYLNDKQHCGSILSTIATKIGPFEQVAALWHTNRAGRKFSIEEFLKKPGVLILGNDPVLRETVWPINAIILKALTDKILGQPDTLLPRHWFFFDEFVAMRRLECAYDLVHLGRSKGVSVLLGVQNTPGLMEVYGEKVANAILEECAHKTFLSVGGHPTAKWIADHFGQVRHPETVVSESLGPGGRTRTTQSSVNDRTMFLPSFFTDLSLPGPGKDLVSVSDLPSLNEVTINQTPFDYVLSLLHPLKERQFPPLIPRTDTAGQRLQPWSDEEKRRFGDPPPGGGQSPDSQGAASKPPRPGGLPPGHRIRY